MKLIIGIAVFLILISCSNNSGEIKVKNELSKRIYDVKINYFDASNRRWRQSFDDLISGDSTYLFFENDFENQRLELLINNELVVVDTLTTDQSLDLAYHYSFKNQGLKNIGIRIDDGKMAYLELDPELNIWRIKYYKDSLLVISYSKHAPFYE